MTAWPGLVSFLILTVVLVIAAVVDWRTGRIPDALTWGATAAGVVWAIVVGLAWPESDGVGAALGAAFFGWAAGFVPMMTLFFLGGMGGGDVKLAGAVGALTASWACALATLFNAFVIAAILAVVIMIRHRIVKRTIGRIFSAALTASARVRPVIADDSPRIPFAVAMAIGGLIAGAEHLLGVAMPWS